MQSINRYAIFFFITLTLSGCFSHPYIITKSEATRREESIKLRFFTIFGAVPIYNDLNPETVCPGERIRMINIYDSMLDGAFCGLSLFLVCPHTVGVECVK